VTDRSGIELKHVEPRLFGKVPPLGLLGSGVVLLLVAIALLALADWVLGPLLLVLALALLGLYAVVERHLPPSRLSRGAVGAVWRARDELRFAGCSTRAWMRAGGRVAALHREDRRLRRERDAVQHELGGAAYREDEAAVERLRGRMQELDAAVAGCSSGMEEARSEARARIAQARGPLRTTEISKP
jgi:outer membrane murein-binding lipoprotein Lpp